MAPPKKAAASGTDDNALAGFTVKETKLLAAAFLSCTGDGAIDYDRLAPIAGYANKESARANFSATKKKAVEKFPEVANFLGSQVKGNAATTADAKKPKAGTKRKAAAPDEDADDEENEDKLKGEEKVNESDGAVKEAKGGKKTKTTRKAPVKKATVEKQAAEKPGGKSKKKASGTVKKEEQDDGNNSDEDNV